MLCGARRPGRSTADEIFYYANGAGDRSRTQTVSLQTGRSTGPARQLATRACPSATTRERDGIPWTPTPESTVVFNDPNGKEIARATHTTNDYGSFSGVFTAPRDRLTGRMTIQVLGEPSRTTFRVEEYKRPKFQVEFAPPDAAASWRAGRDHGQGDGVHGAPQSGGAKVKWRVVRGVQLPYWCWWWRPGPEKAIAHGSAVTEPDGHQGAVSSGTGPVRAGEGRADVRLHG